MGKKAAAAFSEWQSPVTSNLLAGKTAALSQPSLTPSGQVYWLELKAHEQGRVTLTTRDNTGVVSVSPPAHSGVDLRPHERKFGDAPAHPGTSYVVVEDDVYFVNHKDQGLYRQSVKDPSAGATLLTRSTTHSKFSDLLWDGLRQRLICVAVDQSRSEPVTCVSAIDVKTGSASILVKGSNHYMSPALDPTGTKLAWIQWNNPNMPWEGTELCVADVLTGGTVISPRVVAGGSEEAVQQPVWGLDGSLYFLSDKSGRWSLYKYMRRGETVPLLAEERDIGIIPWPLGRTSFHPLPTGKLLVIYRSSPSTPEALGLLDPDKGEVTALNTGLDNFGATLAVRHIQANGHWKIALVSTSQTQGSKVVSLEVPNLEKLTTSTPADWQTLQVASESQNGNPSLPTATPPPAGFPQYYPMMYVNPVMAVAYQAAYAAALAATATLQRQNSQGGSSTSTSGLPPAQSPFASVYPPGAGVPPPNAAAPNGANPGQQPPPMFAAYPYPYPMAVAPYPVGFVPFGMPQHPYAGYPQFQVPPQGFQQAFQGFPGGLQGYQQLRQADPNRGHPRFMFPEGARYRRRVFSFRISLRSLLQFIVFGIIFYKNVLQHISWARFTVLLIGGLLLFLTSHYAPLRRFISSLGNTTAPDGANRGQQPPQRRGVLSEIAVIIIGFVASLIPAWNYNAQDAAAFQAAQDMFADEDENRDNNRNGGQRDAEPPAANPDN